MNKYKLDDLRLTVDDYEDHCDWSRRIRIADTSPDQGLTYSLNNGRERERERERESRLQCIQHAGETPAHISVHWPISGLQRWFFFSSVFWGKLRSANNCKHNIHVATIIAAVTFTSTALHVICGKS